MAFSVDSKGKASTPFVAFGLTVGEKNGRKRFGHAGGIDGFNSFPAYFPASGVTIAVLANVEGPAAPELEEKLEVIYFGD